MVATRELERPGGNDALPGRQEEFRRSCWRVLISPARPVGAAPAIVRAVAPGSWRVTLE